MHQYHSMMTAKGPMIRPALRYDYHGLSSGDRLIEDQFIRSIARRLLVIDESFTVHVNDSQDIETRDSISIQISGNPGTWQTDELSNGQQFQWWAGFCKDTIPDEEQRGFVVYVRGKLAQTPWFFDLSGGVWGQHGMQYFTGEVQGGFSWTKV